MKKIVLIGFVLSSLISLSSKMVSAGELVNKHLPSWVNVDISLRHRFEWRNNFDFNDSADDKDGFNLWRSRIGILLKPHADLKLFYQFQDSRISDDQFSGSKSAYEDWAETRQLWAEGQTSFFNSERIGLSGLIFKFGRQELSYGSQRLVGPVNWSNVGQVFDGGKFTLKFDKYHASVDLFAGGKVQIKSPREQNDLFDGSANERLAGYYLNYSGFKDIVLEQYLLTRNTDGKRVLFGQTGDGEIEDYTLGVRTKGKVPQTSVDYEFEAAHQFGHSGALDVDSQMAVAIVGYTFNHSWKPRLSFEFDYASGDASSSDTKRNTFNNLYPTNHVFYGYMDFVSLQNIRAYRYQANIVPHKKLELEAALHLFYLDNSSDNLYAANQTIKRATVAGADEHVGDEIDLLAKYKMCSYADVWLGYSHFFAGNFLDDTGTSDDADFVYLQTTLNF